MTDELTAPRNGGEAVVEVLQALGVRHVFGVASVHNLPIVDALGRCDAVRYVPTRHEQGAVHAADGYARATGDLGVALTSTGPGAANAMGALFEAAFASSRVLMLTGQVDTGYLGRGLGFLHEAERQLDMLRSVVRRAETVRRREDLTDTLLGVARDVLTGRPQPGAVEIPADLQVAVDRDPPVKPLTIRPTAPPRPALAAAADLLRAARRPLIWAGGGAVDASAPLRVLAERLPAPVLTTIEGRGVLPEDHPLALGANADLAVVEPLITAADVVLAVGTRFEQNTPMAQGLRFPGQLVHVDLDPAVLNRVYRAAVPVLGDARMVLTALLDLLPGGGTDRAWPGTARETRRAADAETAEAMGADFRQMLRAIRAALPGDAVVVKDVTVAAHVWLNRALPVSQPRTAMRPTSVGIGPGLPLAIGAALGSGRPTLAVVGDGGLVLNLAELATVVQEQLPVVTCVLNDAGYGVLRHVQDLAFGGRHVGVDLVTPDFAAVAAAVGMPAARAGTPDEFTAVFGRAVAERRPWLVDVDIRGMIPMQLRPQRPGTR